MLSTLHVTGTISAGSIVTGVFALLAAWVSRSNKLEIKEVKDTVHKVNKAVNDVEPGESTIGEKVSQIQDTQAQVKRSLEEAENGS